MTMKNNLVFILIMTFTTQFELENLRNNQFDMPSDNFTEFYNGTSMPETMDFTGNKDLFAMNLASKQVKFFVVPDLMMYKKGYIFLSETAAKVTYFEEMNLNVPGLKKMTPKSLTLDTNNRAEMLFKKGYSYLFRLEGVTDKTTVFFISFNSKYKMPIFQNGFDTTITLSQSKDFQVDGDYHIFNLILLPTTKITSLKISSSLASGTNFASFTLNKETLLFNTPTVTGTTAFTYDTATAITPSSTEQLLIFHVKTKMDQKIVADEKVKLTYVLSQTSTDKMYAFVETGTTNPDIDFYTSELVNNKLQITNTLTQTFFVFKAQIIQSEVDMQWTYNSTDSETSKKVLLIHAENKATTGNTIVELTPKANTINQKITSKGNSFLTISGSALPTTYTANYYESTADFSSTTAGDQSSKRRPVSVFGTVSVINQTKKFTSTTYLIFYCATKTNILITKDNINDIATKVNDGTVTGSTVASVSQFFKYDKIECDNFAIYKPDAETIKVNLDFLFAIYETEQPATGGNNGDSFMLPLPFKLVNDAASIDEFTTLTNYIAPGLEAGQNTVLAADQFLTVQTKLYKSDAFFLCVQCPKDATVTTHYNVCVIQNLSTPTAKKLFTAAGTATNEYIILGIQYDNDSFTSVATIDLIKDKVMTNKKDVKMFTDSHFLFTGTICLFQAKANATATTTTLPSDYGYEIIKLSQTKTILNNATKTQVTLTIDPQTSPTDAQLTSVLNKHNNIIVQIDAPLQTGLFVLTNKTASKLKQFYVCEGDDDVFKCDNLQKNYYDVYVPLILFKKMYLYVFAEVVDQVTTGQEFEINTMKVLTNTNLQLNNFSGLSTLTPTAVDLSNLIASQKVLVAATSDTTQMFEIDYTTDNTSYKNVLIYKKEAVLTASKTPIAVLTAMPGYNKFQMTTKEDYEMVIAGNYKYSTTLAALGSLNVTQITMLKTPLLIPTINSTIIYGMSNAQVPVGNQLGPMESQIYKFTNFENIYSKKIIVSDSAMMIPLQNLGFSYSCMINADYSALTMFKQEQVTAFTALEATKMVVNAKDNYISLDLSSIKKDGENCFLMVNNKDTMHFGDLQFTASTIIKKVPSKLFSAADIKTDGTDSMVELTVASGDEFQLYVDLDIDTILQGIQIETTQTTALVTKVSMKIGGPADPFTGLTDQIFTSQKTPVLELRTGQLKQRLNISIISPAVAATATVVSEVITISFKTIVYKMLTLANKNALDDSSTTTDVAVSFSVENDKMKEIVLQEILNYQLYYIKVLSDSNDTGTLTVTYDETVKDIYTKGISQKIGTSGTPPVSKGDIKLLSTKPTSHNIMFNIDNKGTGATKTVTFTFKKEVAVKGKIETDAVIATSQSKEGELTKTVPLATAQEFLGTEKTSVYFTLDLTAALQNRFIEFKFEQATEVSTNFALKYFYKKQNANDASKTSKSTKVKFIGNTFYMLIPPVAKISQLIIFGTYKGKGTGQIKYSLMESKVESVVEKQKCAKDSDEYKDLSVKMVGTKKSYLAGEFSITCNTPGEVAIVRLLPTQLKNNLINIYQQGTQPKTNTIKVHTITTPSVSYSRLAALSVANIATDTQSGQQTNVLVALASGIYTFTSSTKVDYAGKDSATLQDLPALQQYKISHIQSLKNRIRNNQATTPAKTAAFVIEAESNPDFNEQDVMVIGSFIVSATPTTTTTSSSKWKNVYIAAIVVPIVFVIVVVIIIVVCVMKKKSGGKNIQN